MRGGKRGGPPLWMVHALGDSSSAFERLLASSLGSNFEILSGLATAFDGPDEYRRHPLDRVRTMAETADPGRSEALWRYHMTLSVASPEALWRIGRGAAAASRMDGLGEEYRASPVPSLYYWSRTNTPPETEEYIQRYRLRNVEFTGGHWPMIEQPKATANAIAAFFQPLFLAGDESPSR